MTDLNALAVANAQRWAKAKKLFGDFGRAACCARLPAVAPARAALSRHRAAECQDSAVWLDGRGDLHITPSGGLGTHRDVPALRVPRFSRPKAARFCRSVPTHWERRAQLIVHRRTHECPGDDPGASTTREAVTSLHCRIACGAQSLRCSTGSPCACAVQPSALSSRSTASRSPITSASRCWRTSCVRAAARGERLAHGLSGERSATAALAARQHPGSEHLRTLTIRPFVNLILRAACLSTENRTPDSKPRAFQESKSLHGL
jgi:hypothetical protein